MFLNALSTALIDAIPLKCSLSRETSSGLGSTGVWNDGGESFLMQVGTMQVGTVLVAYFMYVAPCHPWTKALCVLSRKRDSSAKVDTETRVPLFWCCAGGWWSDEIDQVNGVARSSPSDLLATLCPGIASRLGV